MPDSEFSRSRSSRPLLRRARTILYAVVSMVVAIASLTFATSSAQAATIPALSQAFSPASIYVTGTSILTVTVTNVDGAQHNNLAFTDTLPAGLTVAYGTPSTDCPGGLLNPSVGDPSFTWSGHVTPSTASCTVNVPVTGSTAGSYTNGPTAFAVGSTVTRPAAATLHITGGAATQPTWPNLCDANASGYLFQNPTAADDQPTLVSTVDIQSNAVSQVGEIGDYVNAVGYNKKDQYMWGWDHRNEDLVRLGSDFSRKEFSVASILDSSGVPLGAVDSNGFNIGDISPQGILYLATTYGSDPNNNHNGHQRAVEIDLTTPSPTLLYDGQLSPPTQVQQMADWVFDGGWLYGVGQTQQGNVELFATDPTPDASNHDYLDVYAVQNLSHTSSFAAADASSASTAGWGADYLDSSHNLYADSNPTGNLYVVNLPTLTNNGTISPSYTRTVKASRLGAKGSAVNGNDGARCPAPSSPAVPTISAAKDVVSYAAPGDQFTLTITQGGTTVADPVNNSNPSSTTLGTLGPQAEIGPLPATVGTTYRIAEAAAAGTSTDLTQYSKQFVCQDDNDGTAIATTPSGANGTAVTVTIPARTTPADVDCTVTNTAGPPTIEVHKTVGTSGREKASDQFVLAISGGTLGPVTPVTTNGPVTGPQTRFLGPITVDDGTTYTISESGAPGTTLSDYDQNYSCTDQANGTTTSGRTTNGQATYAVPAGAVYSPQIICTFTNDAIPPAITVTKSESATTVSPGTTLTYTVRVSNTGTVPADGTALSDPIPSGISAFTSWTCAGSAVACPAATSSGAITDTYPSFPMGQTFTYTVTAKVSDTPPGTITNTATATPPGNGTCTNSLGTSAPGVQCSASVDATATLPTVAALKHVASFFDAQDEFDLTLTGPGITGGNSASTVPGTTGDQARINPLAAQANATYTLTESVHSGTTNNFGHYLVSLACVDTANGNATVATSAVQSTATSRSATFTIPTAVANAANVLCTFTNTARFASISLTKTLTQAGATLTPGGQVQFTVVVADPGPIPADGTVVADPIPTGIASFDSVACVASGGAICPISTVGPINDTITTFPSGGSLTFTITATATGTPPRTVTNTATATPPLHGTCNGLAADVICPASASVTSTPIISLSKTVDGRVNPTDQFTVTLGSSSATTSGTSTGVNRATVGPLAAHDGDSFTISETASGTTDLNQYVKTYTCKDSANGVTLASGRLATSGTTTSLGQVVIPSGSSSIPNVQCVIENRVAAPVIGITKTSNSTLSAGGPVVYTVTVSNDGVVAADGTEFADVVPTGIASFDSWTCTSAPTAGLCPHASSSAAGAIDETIASFPVGETLTYTVDATAASTLPAAVTNVATADPPSGGTCVDNSTPPCRAQVTLQTNNPTISANKHVVSVINSTDRFRISITGGSITSGNTAVTNAGQIGDSAFVGPIEVDTVSTYTVAETAVSGTLSDYDIGYTCVDTANGDAPVASGSTSSTSFTVPVGSLAAHVNCVFTNTAKPQTVSVQKNVVSYYAPGDRFTMRIDGSGIVSGNTADTTAGVLGTQATVTPPITAVAGRQYSASETALSGSLAHYTTTYSCIDTANGGATVASGAGASVGFVFPTSTPPAQVMCTFTNTARPTVNVTKTTTATRIVPAGDVPYTVVVTNTSPLLSADQTVIDDPVPVGISSFQGWTCTSAPATTLCPSSSGSGAIHETVATFPAGSSLTYLIDARAVTIPADPVGNPPVTNTVTVTPPTGALCDASGTLTSPPCAATVTLPVIQPTVTVQKNVVSYFNGTDRFTVRMDGALIHTNNTATTTPGQTGIQARISPTLQAEASTVYHAYELAAAGSLQNYSEAFACVDTANGNAPVSTTPDGTGTGVNFTVPTPAEAANVVCTIINTAIPPRIGLSKTVTETIAVPGKTLHYQVTVTNTGVSDASGTIVQDGVPAGITAFTSWSCTAAGGAACATPSTSSGPINQRIPSLPVGGSVTYAIVGSVSVGATGTITNTAFATPPNSGTCTTAPVGGATCQASVATPLDLPTVSIQKDVASYYAAGDQFHLAVTGPGISGGNSSDTTVGQLGVQATTSPRPATPAQTYSVTETADAGSLADYTVAYTCVDTANGGASVASGSGVSSFTFTMPIGAVASAKVLCTLTNTARPSIALSKTTTATGLTTANVGYTVTVSAASLVGANGTILDDAVPTGISSFQSWTCTAAGGAVCPNATGSGAIHETIATLPSGGSLVYQIVAVPSATPPAQVTNTAVATAPTNGFCAATGAATCVASVTIAPDPVITITKTVNVASVKPNDSIQYTVIVTNTGVIDISGVHVTDPIPTGITAFTAVTCSAATGGASCPVVAATGALDTTIGIFPVGATATFAITATVGSLPPVNIENTATAVPPTPTRCGPGYTAPPCTATVNTPSLPIVTVTKTADLAGVFPGDTIVYTITASNVGTAAADGSSLDDDVPAGLTNLSWSCAQAGGAICPNATGAGAIHETIATMPGGSVLTYTVTATVLSTPPSPITNEVTFDPHVGVCGDPGNPPIPCDSVVNTPVYPQVSITKTANVGTILPGSTVVYTVTATNTGAIAADGSTLTDPIPTGLVSFSWTCTAQGGAVCANAGGVGSINETIATFPIGSSLVYLVTAAVSATPPSLVTNTATLIPPPNGVCTPGNTAAPCVASVAVPGAALAFTGAVIGGLVQLGVTSLLGGGVILMLLAIRRRRRNGRHTVT